MPCLCCAMIQCCPLIFGNAMVGLIHTHLRVLMWIFYILLYSDGTNLGIFYVLSPIILCSSASGKHESNLISCMKTWLLICNFGSSFLFGLILCALQVPVLLKSFVIESLFSKLPHVYTSKILGILVFFFKVYFID